MLRRDVILQRFTPLVAIATHDARTGALKRAGTALEMSQELNDVIASERWSRYRSSTYVL